TITLYDVTTNTQVSASYTFWTVENYTDSYDYSYCYYGSCSGAFLNSYTGSSAYDATYQGPGYDYSYNYASPGTNTGTVVLWSNTSSWDPTYMTGYNNTLSTSDKYVALTNVYFYAGADLFAYSDYWTGSTGAYFDYNPAGSASAAVNAVPTAGALTVTSITATAV
ncbi:MAG: hypothetical protein L3K09_05860, partial [Thermoplasmata archaeon]|nr:hypothetical protein [Thermoplasmata archaeon]